MLEYGTSISYNNVPFSVLRFNNSVHLVATIIHSILADSKMCYKCNDIVDGVPSCAGNTNFTVTDCGKEGTCAKITFMLK